MDGGLSGRGELWAMRCLDLLESSLGELEDEREREEFLSLRERRSCLAVLAQFFARYVSINSFTETVLVSTSRGEVMRWPANPGRRLTL